MAVTVKQETLREIREAVAVQGPDQGVRFYQGRLLDELPGAAFVTITLVWIISSFAHLIW